MEIVQNELVPEWRNGQEPIRSHGKYLSWVGIRRCSWPVGQWPLGKYLTFKNLPGNPVSVEELVDFKNKSPKCLKREKGEEEDEEGREREMKDGYSSPSSSPPTPPSPLPVSVGPGGQKYCFSSSPSPSPPFSPPLSSRTSTDNINIVPLLYEDQLPRSSTGAAFTFSLDSRDPNQSDSKSSCLKDL